MAHDLTGVNAFTAPVTVPDTGDARTAASVELPFQALTDRTTFLNDQNNLRIAITTALKEELSALWIGVRNVSSSDGSTIVVAGFQARRIGTSNHAPQSYVSVTPTIGATATWYYLYGYSSLGAIAYEGSTDGPDVSYTFKDGDTTRVFICSYYVDGAGDIRPFYKVGQKYLYRKCMYDLEVVSGLTATTFTDRSLAAWIPPTAKIAKLRVQALDHTAGFVQVKTKGDTFNGFEINAEENERFEIETDSNRDIQYRIQAGGGLLTATIQCEGYYE